VSVASRRAADAVDSVRVLAVVVLGVIALVSVLPRSLWLQVAAVEGVFLAGPLLYSLVSRVSFDAFSLRLPSLRILPFIVMASLGSMWLLNGLTILQEYLLVLVGMKEYARHAVDQLQKPVMEAMSQGRVRSFLLFSLAPGVCEEFLFRGLVFRGFARSFSGGRALIYTALLFAAFHVEPIKMLPMFFLGLLFGSLVYWSRSLWAGVFAHAANNGAVLVVADFESRGYPISQGPIYLYPISAVVFVLAMVCLWLDYKKSSAILV
jgi:membrane protease YdiL (CAAX protease family)